MTAGYLKEVQNLRDQLFRKNNGEDLDFYNVNFFDINDIGPPTLEKFNLKLKELKDEYEIKTLQLSK